MTGGPALATASATPHASEWRAHWLLLLCALLGISTPSISIYALGQFLGPLESEFGWSRSEATAGLSISLILGFLVSPLVGRLVDKVNARMLAIPGLVLLAAGIAAFSLATPSLGVWIALWAFHSGVGALVGPTVWLAVVSHAFERHRSLAIAIALCGNNLSTAFGPGLARILLDEFGWRMSFQLLAACWIGPVLVLALLVFFDRRPRTAPAVSAAAEKPPEPERLRAVFGSGLFIRIAMATLLVTMAASAYSIHLSPALGEKGLSLAAAALVAGFAGLAAVPGKLATGWLFARTGPGVLAAAFMAMLAAAAMLMATPSDSLVLALAASGLLGIAGGASLTLVTVLVSRYFPSAVFGVVYGTVMSITALAAAIGPLAASLIYDAAGAYAPAFWVGVPMALVAALLMQRLRPLAGALGAVRPS